MTPGFCFATVLDDLATITASHIQPAGGRPAFTVITAPARSTARPSISPGVSHRPGHA